MQIIGGLQLHKLSILPAIKMMKVLMIRKGKQKIIRERRLIKKMREYKKLIKKKRKVMYKKKRRIKMFKKVLINKKKTKII